MVRTSLGRAFLRNALYPVLRYKEAVELASVLHDMSAQEVFDYASSELKLDLDIDGLNNIPASGPCILIANHPTGIADGICVYDVLRKVRGDFAVMGNRDGIRVVPRLDEIMIPVEWNADQKRSRASTRETLAFTQRAFDEGRCVIIFPSGRLGYLTFKNLVTLRGLSEREWQSSMVGLADRYNAPIVPMRIDARNSAMFYAFSWLSNELRDVTMFHELLNKRGARYRVSIARPLTVDQLPEDNAEATSCLQDYVESGLNPALRPAALLDAPEAAPGRSARRMPGRGRGRAGRRRNARAGRLATAGP